MKPAKYDADCGFVGHVLMLLLGSSYVMRYGFAIYGVEKEVEARMIENKNIPVDVSTWVLSTMPTPSTVATTMTVVFFLFFSIPVIYSAVNVYYQVPRLYDSTASSNFEAVGETATAPFPRQQRQLEQDGLPSIVDYNVGDINDFLVDAHLE